MSGFKDFLAPTFQISERAQKSIDTEAEAALECFRQFERDWVLRSSAREKLSKDKSRTTTLQRIDENGVTDDPKKPSEPESLPNGITMENKSDSDSAMENGNKHRASKKRTKNEVDGYNSPEVDKRQKRNASVKAQTIISKQVNVNLTQKLRREGSTEGPRASRHRNEAENKENNLPRVPLPVQIKQEKISIPPEPMDMDSIPLSVTVKQENDKAIMPPPVAPLPKTRKAQKDKEQTRITTNKDTDEESESTRRSTRTRKQTDVESMPPPQEPRKEQKYNDKSKDIDKETDEESESARRTTRTRKQTDVESMPPPQDLTMSLAKCDLCPKFFKGEKGLKIHISRAHRVVSATARLRDDSLLPLSVRGVRASSRASARATPSQPPPPPQDLDEGSQSQPAPAEARPKRTRTKKKISEWSSSEFELGASETGTASPTLKPRPKRTRRGQKAAEMEAQKVEPQVDTDFKKPDKQQEKPKEPDLDIQKTNESYSAQKETRQTRKDTNKDQDGANSIMKDTQSEKSDGELISPKEERISRPETKNNNNNKINQKVTKQDSDEIKKTTKSRIPRGKKVADVESQSSVESGQETENEARALKAQESDDAKKIAKMTSKNAKPTLKSLKAIDLDSQSSEDVPDSLDSKKTAKVISKTAKGSEKTAKSGSKTAKVDSQDSEEFLEAQNEDVVDKIMLEETRVLDKVNVTVTKDMDRTVVLPNGVYNHAPVTPKTVCNGNETVVLENRNDTFLIEKHGIMDSTVVLEKVTIPTAPKLTDDSLITNDSSEDFQTPPKSDAPVQQPTSAVKEKVQKFEELAARTTRTKTRAMAKMEDDSSTPPDKIIKPVLSTESLNKMNNLIFNGKQVSKSASKPHVGAPAPPSRAAAASASKANSISKYKEAAEEALRREKDKEDAIKKKEALLEAKREAQRRRREEKMAAAAAARAATEESRRRQIEQMSRDRMEKQAHADQGKIERLKEIEKKKLELARKVAETEERRKAEEKARLERLAEEQRRAELARKKQLEEQAQLKKEEAKMAKEIEKRQKEYLDKMKMKLSHDSKSYTPLKHIGQCVLEPVYMQDGFQYLNSDEECEETTKMPVPTWSVPKARLAALGFQADLPQDVVDRLFSIRIHTPDLREIFPAIERNRLKRTSSAVWRTPPRLPALME